MNKYKWLYWLIAVCSATLPAFFAWLAAYHIFKDLKTADIVAGGVWLFSLGMSILAMGIVVGGSIDPGDET